MRNYSGIFLGIVCVFNFNLRAAEAGAGNELTCVGWDKEEWIDVPEVVEIDGRSLKRYRLQKIQIPVLDERTLTLDNFNLFYADYTKQTYYVKMGSYSLTVKFNEISLALLEQIEKLAAERFRNPEEEASAKLAKFVRARLSLDGRYS